MADRAIVDALRTQLRIPAIVAPMFLISGPDLVISAGKAGLLGAIPAPNARTIPDLDAWFARISTELGEVERADLWAVNMIVHKSYDRFDAELDLICRYRPRIVVTALGSPRRVLDAVHGYGGAVFADTIDPNQAKKAIDAGADGLILVAHGAGGHTGRFNPFAFVEEVRSFWDGPLILGGGIATGRAIRAAEALGADFAYLGTRFIAARESLVSDENRAMLLRCGLTDIVTTAAVSGVPANWMRESLEAAGFTPDALATDKKIDFSNLHGDSKAWKTIWGAGHGVGATRQVQTMAEIADELAAEYATSFRSDQSLKMNSRLWRAEISTYWKGD